MSPWQQFQTWRQLRRRRRAGNTIRETAAMFGYPEIAAMSDDELEAALVATAPVIASAGLSAEEVAEFGERIAALGRSISGDEWGEGMSDEQHQEGNLPEFFNLRDFVAWVDARGYSEGHGDKLIGAVYCYLRERGIAKEPHGMSGDWPPVTRPAPPDAELRAPIGDDSTDFGGKRE